MLLNLLKIVENRSVLELKLRDHCFQLADEGQSHIVHDKLLALQCQIEGFGLQVGEVVLQQHAMQSSLAGEEITVPVMVGQLFRKHALFVHPAAPDQMKRPGILVLVLQPTPIQQHSPQPEILRIEDKDLINRLNAQSPPILAYQIIESLAFPIDDEVNIGASFLIPFLLLPPSLDLIAHLTLILGQFIRNVLRGYDVCTLMEHRPFFEADAWDGGMFCWFLGGERSEGQMQGLLWEVGGRDMVGDGLGFVESVVCYVWGAMEGELQLRCHSLTMQLLLLLFLLLSLLLPLSLNPYLLLRLLNRSLLHRLIYPHNLSRRVMIHLRDPRRHRGSLLLDRAIHLRGLGVVIDEEGDDEVQIIVAFGIGVGLNHSLCSYMKVWNIMRDHSLRKMELR